MLTDAVMILCDYDRCADDAGMSVSAFVSVSVSASVAVSVSEVVSLSVSVAAPHGVV